MTQPDNDAKVRAEFEAWCKDNAYYTGLDRNNPGFYFAFGTCEAWNGWQAATASSAAELAALRAENEALKKDAARYQHLRDKMTWVVDVLFRSPPEVMKWSVNFPSYYGAAEDEDDLDAAIDSAIAASTGEKL